MKCRCLLTACCVLSSSVWIFAQAGATPADPISGTWTGDIGLDLTNRKPITMVLKFDGKTAVSGTFTGLPEPGEVKTGTFDPKTGALKLGLGITGEGAVRLVFDGTAIRGTATGRVTGDNNTGSFFIALPAGAGAAGVSKQPGGSEMAALRTGFTELSGWVVKAADLVPTEKYTYRPAPTVRTYGQLIAHIADSHNYYCARAAGRPAQWSDAIEKGNTDKATIVEKLKQSIDACNAAYGGAGQAGPMIANVGHTSLHYGNIITYMRMLGLVPPSSQ
jgi:DinB family protein